MSSQVVILSITFPDRDSAMQIGQLLVDRHLIACAQLLPIHSVFRWEGKVQSEDEVLLQGKTTEQQLTAIEALIKQHHSYDVPEMIATPVVWGHQPYLDWVETETGNPSA
ncbi:MAG: divalent-cation tolerance protein CutA [Bacteroidota bacterium]